MISNPDKLMELREKLKNRFKNVKRIDINAAPIPMKKKSHIRIFEKENFYKTEHFIGEPF